MEIGANSTAFQGPQELLKGRRRWACSKKYSGKLFGPRKSCKLNSAGCNPGYYLMGVFRNRAQMLQRVLRWGPVLIGIMRPLGRCKWTRAVVCEQYSSQTSLTMSVQLFIKVPNIMQMPASTMQSTMTQRAITKMSRRYEPLFSSIPLFVLRLVMLMRCLICFVLFFAFAMLFVVC